MGFCWFAGTTFICQACGSGYFQPSGASVVCHPCPAGSYQNATQSILCNRCPVGQYQDEEGSSSCKPCPAGATTGLLGSASALDCGCEAGSINVNDNDGTLNCVPCGEGLRCPFSSSLQTLLSGRRLPRVMWCWVDQSHVMCVYSTLAPLGTKNKLVFVLFLVSNAKSEQTTLFARVCGPSLEDTDQRKSM